MHLRGRTLRFTAVTAMVVLTLTGFSTGRHGRGSSHGGSGGGGGCSSSRQDHDSSSSTSGGLSSGGSTSGSTSGGSSYDDDYDDDTYGTSGSSTSGGSSYNRRPTHRSTASASGSGKALRDGTAKLISCATAERPWATVEITNPNSRRADFEVEVTFYDDSDLFLDSGTSDEVSVPAKGTATTKVKVSSKHYASMVGHCEVDEYARPAY